MKLLLLVTLLCLSGCGRSNNPSVCMGGVKYWRVNAGTHTQTVLAVDREGKPVQCEDRR